ncbi:MAG: PKD domain-containing protein, partial [Flavitalea sp.]
ANIASVDGISNYSWNFGQGPIQTGATPSHIYTTANTYPLILTVTTNGGCQKTFSNTVNVGSTATAVDFTGNPLVVCPTINDQFNGTSATPNLLWDWNFGDGQTGSGQNPTHAYKDTGFFSVTVGVTNNGCRTTRTKNQYIEVLPPIADFVFSVDCNSRTQVTFTDKSITNAAAGLLSYTWDFGDPSVAASNSASPQINYSVPGTYTVKLTVSSANTTCSNSVSKQVIISAPGADFTVDKTEICNDATFTLTSSSDPSTITSYTWTIGTNTPVIAGAIYPTSVPLNGVYDVKLSLTDVNGCKHEDTHPALITISGPTAGFKNNPVHCGKDLITFTDSSTSTSNITSWKYDFGDGNIQTFSSAPFTHQYADTGTYVISLLVTDATTCSNTFSLPTGLTISDPKAYFRQDSAIWCPGAQVIFTDSSSGNGLSYLWNFGDGNIALDRNPSHAYSASSNDYTISLKVTDNFGCADSISREKFIQIKTPVAAFDVKTKSSICSPLIEEFTFKGSGYQTLSWNLGDGTPAFTQFTPTHAYTAFGNFTAVLTVLGNGGCSASASANINITDPATTVFNYIAPETCNRLMVNFSAIPPSGTNFVLFFGDGAADSSQSTTVAHSFTSPAFYQPYLVIKDSSGCVVNINGATKVRIIGAAPLFWADPTERCDPGTVNFTNYTFSNDPVIKYDWDFGDNNTDGSFNTAHLYATPGTYKPSLTVTTQRGCISTLSDTVKIYRTPAVHIISNDTVCLNSAVKFTTSILSTDTAVSYAWYFSDGENSIKAEPAKTFRTIGSIVVNLQTSIPYGCISSTSKPINITKLPTVGQMADQTIMAGQTVVLPATYSSRVIKYLWSPDNSLDCSDCPNPVASPKNSTTYSVRATDNYGCEANGDITVLVICNNNNFFIPNTFSPNNDGVNDHFYPRGTGLVRVAALRIFNRWGELVFEKKDFAANDAKAGWDGTYKGKPAVSDVYIYKIEVICENSQIIPFQGNIFLLR